MILLCGDPADEPLMAVLRELRAAGAEPAFFDLRSMLDADVEVAVGASLAGALRVGDQELDLGRVTAAYVRPFDWRRLPEVAAGGRNSRAWEHARAVDHALTVWMELTSALVVNRLTAGAENNSKPLQLARIRQRGFAVPDTLLTTDPRGALAFSRRHGDVVYKSISGVRSIVSRLPDAGDERLADVVWCPTQFQEYVPGRDVRVHVVGHALFATEIMMPGDDYRYARPESWDRHMRAIELPEEQGRLCRELVAGAGLHVAGIDLRRRVDGRWICFEMNPSPAFSFYENVTGQPIAAAIARLLLASNG